MKRIFLLSLLIGQYAASQATPNWAEHVAPILYQHCTSCHHSGGIAPMPLMTYADAIAEAYPMSGDVASGKMPPWPPDHNYNALAHERLLTDAEKQTIANWITAGTPQGDLALAPPQPVFANNGDLPGTPTLTLQIPTYVSTAGTSDVYRCFVLNTGQSADKFITAFEAIPGNAAMVHHVLVYADTTGTCAALDAADPEIGYTSFGGVGTDNAILLGGWVPGTSPLSYPANFGVKLPHNAQVVVQIHYPAGTTGMTDSTELHFFLQPASATMREVYIIPALNHYSNINAPLSIPANTTSWFHEQQALPLAISLLGVAPHMHLIGRSIASYGVTQTGDTDRYISIPDWDFHWQGFFMLKQIRKIDAGTTLYADAFYDNTVNNEENPNNPPQDVSAGENTTDEMMLVYYVFSQYQPGDENIMIDSTTTLSVAHQPYYHGQQLLSPYPNPARSELVAKMYLEVPARGALQLWSSTGTLAWQGASRALPQGYSTQVLDVSHLAAGRYFLKLVSSEGTTAQPVVIR